MFTTLPTAALITATSKPYGTLNLEMTKLTTARELLVAAFDTPPLWLCAATTDTWTDAACGSPEGPCARLQALQSTSASFVLMAVLHAIIYIRLV